MNSSKAGARAELEVLLVCHEATRTGAPRVAVQIASALRTDGASVTTLLRWPGPLSSELRSVSQRFRLEFGRRIRAGLRRTWPRWHFADRLDEAVAFANLVLRRRPDLLYANTVKSAAYLRPALRLGIKTVLHVHETETLASDTLRRYRLDQHYADIRLVACSQAVAEDLCVITRRPLAEISVVESHVDVERTVALAASGDELISVANEGSLTIGACASADSRKGVDLWLDAANEVRQLRPDLDLRFIWVGRVTGDAHPLVGDPTSAVPQFLGEVENPFPLIASMDVFCLPSRADPFPLAVLEAMVLGRPIVAFDVGGVADQVGDCGILVPPEDASAFARALVALLDDPHRRERLGVAAAARVRERFGLGSFNRLVVAVVRAATGDSTRYAGTQFRVPAHGTHEPVSTFLLHAFDPSTLASVRASPTPSSLPYRAEALANAGIDLELSDEMYRGLWVRPRVKAVIARLEGLAAPFLQTLLTARRLAASDVVIAMFESQANSLAMLRALRIRPFTRPRFVVISCWLARDLENFGPWRRRLYRFTYRSVDRLVFFSSNQADVFAHQLGMSPDRLRSIPFGVDHEYFEPRPGVEKDAVVAVGRDLGRDWPTFLDAVRDAPFRVKIACRPGTLDGLDVPPNVEALGWISRDQYRELLAEARLVVVATRAVNYPTGQSVLLEAMSMAKCCVATATPALIEYVVDHETALLAAPEDAAALRSAIDEALGDDELRQNIGRRARDRVESDFNAPLMWRRIGAVAREVAALPGQ